jgi:hypothetical protein
MPDPEARFFSTACTASHFVGGLVSAVNGGVSGSLSQLIASSKASFTSVRLGS